MRRKLGHTQLNGELLNYMPDHFLRYELTPNSSLPRNASKQSSTSDSSRHDPFIDLLDPVWNRDRSHMTRFPNQIDDRPVIFALLQMIQRQFGQLTTTQPTPQ